MPGPPSGAATDRLLSTSAERARHVADRRALAERVRQAKADSEAALRRADLALDDSRLLVEEAHRRLADRRRR